MRKTGGNKTLYDAFGRTRMVVQDAEGDPATNGDRRRTETTYDAEGRTVSIVTPEGHITFGNPDDRLP